MAEAKSSEPEKAAEAQMAETSGSRKFSESEQVTVEVEASFVPSIDLIKFAQGHLAFLKKIDNIAHYLKQPHVIANAMRRYENYWLPLISHYADRDSSNFLPPIDVHWIWYVHMLCPRQYRNDCIDVIGMVPDHRFIQGKEERINAQVKTQKMWTSFCVGEKYNIDFSQIDIGTTYHKTSIRYQIADASYQQLNFNYQVSLPHYSLHPFLEHAVQRYLKFINLKRLYKGARLDPGYDMHLIWYTHQLSPRAYIHDTSHWLGYILNNDIINPDQESQGKHGKYSMSDEETRPLWQELYDENYEIPGTGNRGSDPRGSLYTMTPEQITPFRSTAVKFSITSVYFDDTDDSSSAKGSLTVSLNRLKLGWYDVEKSQVQYVVPLSASSRPFHWNLESPNMRGIVADGAGKLYVSAQMHTKSAGGCCLSRWTRDAKMDTASRPLNTYIDDTESKHFDLEEGHIRVALEGSLKEMPMIFTISQKGFYKQTVLNPGNKVQLLSPVISLPETTKSTENICHVANHVVKSQSGSSFTVQITHFTTLRNSIVQIYYENDLVAVSHSISKEQLPSEEEVDHEKDCLTLSATKIEPTLIIKSSQGDWAILKGTWEGYKNAADPGHLVVDVLPLTGKHFPPQISVLAKSGADTKAQRDLSIELGQARVDLQNGNIAIRGDCTTVAEQLALSFSVLVLYVLCEPRPGDKPGANRQESILAEKQGGNFNPGQFSLIEAAGYYTDTPSSSYLWWLWHSGSHDDPRMSHQDDNNNDDIVVECPWQSINQQSPQTGSVNALHQDHKQQNTSSISLKALNAKEAKPGTSAKVNKLKAKHSTSSSGADKLDTHKEKLTLSAATVDQPQKEENPSATKVGSYELTSKGIITNSEKL